MEPHPTDAGLWLASQSPRRVQLLEQLGVRPRLLLPRPDEDPESLEAQRPRERPQDYVVRVSLAKLQAARERLQRAASAGEADPSAASWPILCADTTVALGRRILGKPEDADQARAMLRDLSGRRHRVFTAVVLACGPDHAQTLQALSESSVQVADLSPSWVDAYVASGEPFGKAGAYGIQGVMGGWIEGLRGSYSGIMGLPLCETRVLLAQAGVALLGNP